jgi:hypothetical protein
LEPDHIRIKALARVEGELFDLLRRKKNKRYFLYCSVEEISKICNVTNANIGV